MLHIVPRAENKWKIGLGKDTRKVWQKNTEDGIICVYQYANTQDYYVQVLWLTEHEVSISDVWQSEFHFIESDDAIKTPLKSYYTYIPGFNEQYWIKINGQIFSKQ